MNELIPLFKVFMSDEAVERVSHTLRSGFIGQGIVVDEFEKKLKNFFNSNFLVSTNSATSAEHLIFHILKKPSLERSIEINEKKYIFQWPGIFQDDHVLTTPLTCTATNWPILLNGINLRWVDINPNNCNIDIDDLAAKVNQHTKAILVVHWGGYPVDLDALKEIQLNSIEKYGFAPIIIEDCAHAFGSKYKNKIIGSSGNICTFSFQAIKHLTSGDGGCLILNDLDDYKRSKLLRWFGIDRNENRKDFRCESDIPEAGFKMHMNDINASIGLGNFKFVNDFVITAHRENANFYYDKLSNLSGLTLLENSPGFDSSYWLFTIKVENQAGFMRKMEESKIMVSRVHERNDIHSCVKKFSSNLPNLDKLVKEMICIPVGWWLSNEQKEFIVKTIKSGW